MTSSQNNNKASQNTVDTLNPNPSSNDSAGIVLEELISRDPSTKTLAVSSKGKTHYKKLRRRKSSGKKHFKRITIGLHIILLILTLIGIIYIIYNNNKGKNELLNDNKNIKVETIDGADSKDDGKTVVYKGETYRYNEDLVSIVLMGVDQSTLGTNVYGKAGQADAIYIFTYDTKSGKCSLIPVSRETMAEIKIYSTEGTDLGFETMQLCLAYAYGDGKESSCDNTIAALSRIFYNLPLSNYVAMNWDAVEPLNEAIGRITLTSIADVKTEYTTISEGEYITLTGKEAWSYVKYRDTSKLESNADRLARQQHYITEFVNKLIPLAEYDPTIVSKLFDAAGDHMYSNLSESELTYVASDILPNIYSAKDINFVNIDGETIQGEEYAEFYPDEQSLYEAILRVFYLKDIPY